MQRQSERNGLRPWVDDTIRMQPQTHRGVPPHPHPHQLAAITRNRTSSPLSPATAPARRYHPHPHQLAAITRTRTSSALSPAPAPHGFSVEIKCTPHRRIHRTMGRRRRRRRRRDGGWRTDFVARAFATFLLVLALACSPQFGHKHRRIEQQDITRGAITDHRARTGARGERHWRKQAGCTGEK